MAQQLPLDFTASVSVRHRRAQKLQDAEENQPRLFVEAPNLDIHLHSPSEAIAQISGKEPERAILFLQALVGSPRVLKSRRVAFPTDMLDRLLHIAPPAQISMDAAATAVARALWAKKIGLKPMTVFRDGRRLFASSPRWPSGFSIKDVPFSAISAMLHLGIPLEIDDKAKLLMNTKLGSTGQTIATAGLAGSAVILEANNPPLLESLNLPGLAYSGEPKTGMYKMPILLADCLLREKTIKVSPDLKAAIEKATSPIEPMVLDDKFPWTLYPFQARDAAKGKRILETTGGVLLAGDMGSGKLIPNSSKLLTPTGLATVESIRLGDKLIGLDGKPTTVLGVYPHKSKKIYKITFLDDSVAYAGGEHLWAVHSPVMKKRGRPNKVMSTDDLIKAGLWQKNSRGDRNRKWYIPMCKPVQFETEDTFLPLSGYALGALLGDGGLTTNTLRFTSMDKDIVKRLQRELKVEVKHRPYSTNEIERRSLERGGVDPSLIKHCDHVIKDDGRVKAALKSLGVFGKRAWEKSIPEVYKTAPVRVRKALLQGLLDTDGGLSTRGGKQCSSIEFTSTSEQLIDDVRWIIQSLGGTARKSDQRITKYMYNGEKLEGRPSWRISVQLPHGIKPFHVARKRELYVERVKYLPVRGFESIEFSHYEDATCFMVDAPDSLFLLDEFISNHNTTISLGLVHDMDIWPLLVVAPLSAFSTWKRQLSQMGKSAYLATESPSKSWEQIESRNYEAIVISYDRLPAFTELIERYGFKGIVADELQRIRTPGSRRSKALRALSASVPLRIGLSGTPLTNTTQDLLPLGAWLAPSEWKPRANSKELEDLYPGDPVESIAEHLSALQVRRRMQDTGATLPKRNDHRVFIQLTPEQRRALADMEAEAEAAKEEGAFDDPGSKIHAFARLQKMRQIVNCPAAAGVGGPNPKVGAALDLAEDFLAQNRKGVIFCADRTTFRELGAEMDRRKIGWVGIWGATPPDDRIKNEKMFHDNDIAPNGHPTSVVLCTIQAGAESWSASPTGTWLISTAYVYAPSTLSQMECRVYRMNSDPNGPDIEICYIHAQTPGGSLDDRMVEILEVKKHLFAQVVDRMEHVDTTNIHYTMSDLVFLMTGRKDETKAKAEQDARDAAQREQDMKDHAVKTLYAKKGRNKTSAEAFLDQGDQAMTLEDMLASGELEGIDSQTDLDSMPDAFAADFEDDPESDEDGFF